MPALDQCHEHVVRALTKAGWVVAPKPFAIKVIRGHILFVDLEATRQEITGTESILLVEVKCFPSGSSETTELYTAIGQYIVYRSLLRKYDLDANLYLAVPQKTFQTVFERMAASTIAENAIKMVIVDMDSEVVVRWLT